MYYVHTCRADAPITAHMWENALCDDVNVCGYDDAVCLVMVLVMLLGDGAC